MTQALHLIAAFLCALLGYLTFDALGVPAAPLTGSTAFVTVAALAGLRAELPAMLRNLALLVLGLNIGTTVTPEVLEGALRWPLSLSLLALSVLGILALSYWVLRVLFRFDPVSALMAATPGHLSYVLAIASETGRDVPAIAIAQTVRVLVLTLLVPPFVASVFGATGIDVLPELVISPLHLAALALIALPLGWGLDRLHIPASWLLAALVISACGHGSALTPGRLPDLIGTGALLSMGVLIGSRFSGTPLRILLRHILPGLVTTLAALLVACGAVVLGVWALGLPPGLLVVAFAPGGVEAMAAIAMSLGYDPTFVAAHHVFRLILLSVLMPVLTGYLLRHTK
jgi:membrane AbrB-like protein